MDEQEVAHIAIVAITRIGHFGRSAGEAFKEMAEQIDSDDAVYFEEGMGQIESE